MKKTISVIIGDIDSIKFSPEKEIYFKCLNQETKDELEGFVMGSVVDLFSDLKKRNDSISCYQLSHKINKTV